MKKIIFYPLVFIVISLTTHCKNESQAEQPLPSLKEVYKNTFLIGTALNASQIEGRDKKDMTLVQEQFNAITAENILKWALVHPRPDKYNFQLADSFVSFGEQNDMFIVGHTLIWHNQTPDWVFENENGQSLHRDQLLQRMKEHIFTVVGRYKGRINGWDVVNEAFDEQGAFNKKKWYEIIGEDYIEKAFQWAHEADPDAELYYNDYNMWYPGKRDAVINLVYKLQAEDIIISGIGMQGHWGLDYPPLDVLEKSIEAYAATGLKIMITEMDINVLPLPNADTGADITKSYEVQEKLNPYRKGLPDSMQVKLAKRYSELFKILIKHKDAINRVTFWGVQDGVSWTNDWPVLGRTNYPLVFDRNYQPKPAFFSIVKLMEKK